MKFLVWDLPSLIQVFLDFDLFSTNPVRFVPVKLNGTNCTIGKRNNSKAFELAPTTLSVSFAQPHDLANPGANCNSFDQIDSADNLKIFSHVRFSDCDRVSDQVVGLITLTQACAINKSRLA
jgi:hypothetical protein